MPTTIGVVVEVVQLPNGRSFAYHLESGEVIEIDFEATDVPEGTRSAVQGDLLLSGTGRSGRTWVVGLPLDPMVEAHPSCFRLVATGIGVDGWIDMSNGLRLKKAADFKAESLGEELTAQERYVMERYAFCLDGHGEVTSYGIY